MTAIPIARIASLLGEPARMAMLVELMGGRALTATELARAAGVGASTASAHLAQLVDARLLRVTPSGRHRYYAFATPDAARVIEAMMQLGSQLASHAAAAPTPRLVVGPKDAALRAARTCYDHLAGRLGVAITQRLIQDGGLELDDEQAALTGRGQRALAELGIALPPGAPRGSPHGSRSDPLSCRPCLDWSERRHHIAGKLAAYICQACLQRGWIQRRASSRAVDVTPAGKAALQPWMGMDLWTD